MPGDVDADVGVEQVTDRHSERLAFLGWRVGAACFHEIGGPAGQGSEDGSRTRRARAGHRREIHKTTVLGLKKHCKVSINYAQWTPEDW